LFSWPPAWKRAAVLVAAVLCAEAVLRLLITGGVQLYFRHPDHPLALDRAEPYDFLWRIFWVHETKDRRRTESWFPYDAHHPTRGWTLAPGIRSMSIAASTSTRALLNSNSQGLRGKAEYGARPPADKTRIAVFGDSFTFGQEVDDAETFCSRLPQWLPSAEVLNFGVHGYGHDQMLLYLKEKGPVYRPDVVVLSFMEMDMVRNVMAFRDFAKPRYDWKDGSLRLRNVPVPSPEEVVRGEIRRWKLRDAAVTARQAFETATGVMQRRISDVTRGILEEMDTETRRLGAKFVIAYSIPSWEAGEPTGPAEKDLETFCAERKIRFVNLRPAFDTVEWNAETRLYGHWNPEEHLLVARALAEFLRGEVLAGRAGFPTKNRL
jgi:hypothetical protein